MKFKKISLISAGALLVAGTLASCGGLSEADVTEILDAALANKAIVTHVNGDTLSTVQNNIFKDTDSDCLYVAKTFEQDGNVVSFKWTVEEGELIARQEGRHDNEIKLAPSYPEPGQSVTTTLKAVASMEGFEATAEETWQVTFKTEEIQEYTIQNARKVGAGKTLRTYGYITGHMHEEADIYSGVYVASGEYSIGLYAGNISTVWEELGLKVGDLIAFTGESSPYNGMKQVKPSSIEKVTLDEIPADYRPTTPVVGEITAWGPLTDWDTRMVTVDNLVLKTASAPIIKDGETSKHHSAVFTLNGVDVPAYINYHIADAAMAEINATLSEANVGKTFSFEGMLGWYNGPQLTPLHGDDFTLAI